MISPAAGCTPVHSAVAITGPRTNVNSSVTDSNAAAVDISGEAGRSGVAPSIAAQRARTMGPICGIEAPVGTAATNSAHRGVRQRQYGQGAHGGGVEEDPRQQDGALTEAVGELAALRGEQRHGDAGDRRDGARAAVRAGRVLHEEDDADGEHREGLPCGEAREEEGPRTGGAQQLPVSGAVGDRGCHGPCLSAAW